MSGLREAIARGFLDMDEELKQLEGVRSGNDISGSTAVTALVTETDILVANAGDSRCILVRGGEAKAMSEDHKPYNADETRRIVNAGGSVTFRRVNGDLAVSRALGDFHYKQCLGKRAEEQQVSAEPEVRHVERSPQDQFLVLACDGVWDVLTNEELAEWLTAIARSGEHGDDIGAIAEKLLDICLFNKGSKDNMSVIIVVLPGAQFGSADNIDKEAAAIANKIAIRPAPNTDGPAPVAAAAKPQTTAEVIAAAMAATKTTDRKGGK
jgi:serine/threonine protein phosphatase PrpC